MADMAGLPGPLVYCRRNRAAVAPLFGCTAAAVALLTVLSLAAGAIHQGKSELRRQYGIFSVVRVHDPPSAEAVGKELAAAGLAVPARQLPLSVPLPVGRDTAQVYLIAEAGWGALGVTRPPPGQVLLHRGLLQAARLEAGDPLPPYPGFNRLTVAGELEGRAKIGLGPLPPDTVPDVFLVFPRDGDLAALERFVRDMEQRQRGAISVVTREQARAEVAAQAGFVHMVAELILWLSFLVLAILSAAAAWVATRARTADFAILAVLGFPSRKMTGLLLQESLAVSVAGLAAGIVTGLAALLFLRPFLARSGMDLFLMPGLTTRLVLLPAILTLVTGGTAHYVMSRVDPVAVIERAGDVSGG